MKRKILIVICILTMLISGIYLIATYKRLFDHKKSDKKLIKIAKRIENNADLDETIQSKIDFNALRKINDNVVAWITINDTNIDYPIVKGIDNSYYLTHGFDKKLNEAGAIFLDMNASIDFSSNNTFIYGHNMWYGSMFTNLEYFNDMDFFKRHLEFDLYTPNKDYRCEVLSFYTTTNTSESYYLDTVSKESYETYLKMIKLNSIHQSPYEVTTNDHIITLSTCSHELGYSSNLRLLLHAKLVEVD